MTPLADKLAKGLDTGIQTLLSLVKIALFSKRFAKCDFSFKNNDDVLILANGPSLASTVENVKQFVSEKTLLAVNFNVSSPLYEELKPELYVIADPFLWTDPIQMNRLFGELVKKTTWQVNLFIPAQAFKVSEWQTLLKENALVKPIRYNATPIEGGQKFCNFIFRHGLGVPRPHNVLIPSLIVALNLSFKTIYVAGADHSWIKEISVDDDNQLLMNQKHFYDKDQSKAATVKRRDFTTAHLHDTLYHMYVAFKSYFVIRRYAESLNKQIYNITPHSFIDAFDRLKVSPNQ
ncbi:MAG: hypothetical protein Q8909_05475 [Bacteroidota bacterium]|nr:hypothetical protein [Bacteroidota bacterium]